MGGHGTACCQYLFLYPPGHGEVVLLRLSTFVSPFLVFDCECDEYLYLLAGVVAVACTKSVMLARLG